MDRLTEDIVMDILSRLPVKTLLRFKCVSKRWYAIISDPHFAKMHLQRVTGQEGIPCQRIIKTAPLQSLDYEAFEVAGDDGANAVESYQDFGLDPDGFWGVVGSSHGLVCLQAGDGFVLLNPCTKQFRSLPDPGSDFPEQNEFFTGLGYDPVADDYKVVRGVHMPGSNGDVECCIDIYSLKSNSWRCIRQSGSFEVRALGQGIYLNGALHWYRRNTSEEHAIISFDIAREKFKETVPLPAIDKSKLLDDFGIHGGRLFVCRGTWAYEFEAWLMNEYGRKESWTLWYSVPSDGVPGCKYWTIPVAYTSTGKIVVDVDGYYMILFNPEDGTYRKFPMEDADSFEHVVYVETLVSPHNCTEPSRLQASS